MPYAEARRVQEALAAERVAQGDRDLVLLLEHDPIITLGRNSNLGESLASSSGPDEIPVVRVDRGGGPTYHGPGQLVAYPVVALRSAGRGVREFVAVLELALCDLACDLGVPASTRPGQPGAWVRRGERDRKLGSVGLAVRRGVTLHGAALNVSGESEAGFRGFAPCGVVGAVATSLASELAGRAPEVAALAGDLAGAIARRAGFAALDEIDLPVGRQTAPRPSATRGEEASPWT